MAIDRGGTGMRNGTGTGEVISLRDFVRSRETIMADGEGGGHPDLVCVAAYGRGEIEGPDGDAILEHCRACRSCGDKLAMVLLLVDVQERRSERVRRTVAAAAAAAVLVVFLGAAALSGALQAPGDGPEAAAPSARARSEIGSPSLSLAAASSDDVAALGDLGRRLATAERPNRVDLDFIYPEWPAVPVGGIAAPSKRRELALIVDGFFGEATERITERYGSQPVDGEAAALLGMALYLSGDDSDRVQELLQQGETLRRQDLQNYSGWFLANLYLRRGDILSALPLLEDLSKWPDSPGAQAAATLERLGLEAR